MANIRMGFTGTSAGMTEKQKAGFQRFVDKLAENGQIPREFHYGDCVGADAEAFEIISKHSTTTICHPPTNESKRAWTNPSVSRAPDGYLERNRAIVEESDLLLATPEGFSEERRSGTWSTVRYARKMKKPVLIIFPDGTGVQDDAT